jgi:hypothetical protein
VCQFLKEGGGDEEDRRKRVDEGKLLFVKRLNEREPESASKAKCRYFDREVVSAA